MFKSTFCPLHFNNDLKEHMKTQCLSLGKRDICFSHCCRWGGKRCLLKSHLAMKKVMASERSSWVWKIGAIQPCRKEEFYVTFPSSEKRKPFLFFPLCCFWQDCVRLQLTYTAHWARFSKSLCTLHVLDFSSPATAPGGGRVWGVERGWAQMGFSHFLPHFACGNILTFMDLDFLKVESLKEPSTLSSASLNEQLRKSRRTVPVHFVGGEEGTYCLKLNSTREISKLLQSQREPVTGVPFFFVDGLV